MAEAAVTKNVVSVSASVEREVTQDVLSITFQTVQSGPDSATVQENLVHFLTEAVEQAKLKANGDEVRVETGSFGISPRYGKKGAIDGYQGSAEMIVYGTDTKTISQLASEIKVMSVSDIQHSVSRKLRKSFEAELTEEVIAAFREKADQYAKLFGFKGFTLINANVQVGGGYRHSKSAGAMRVMASSAAMVESVPTEAGKELVTATVSGSIQLK
jgi:predicted secreted protein